MAKKQETGLEEGKGSLEHSGGIGGSESETFNLDVKDKVVYLQLFLTELDHEWDFMAFGDKVGQFAQKLLQEEVNLKEDKKKTEQYYICSVCGSMTTESMILDDIEHAGGPGMCSCGFTEPMWNEKIDDLDVTTPRTYYKYTQISKKWYDYLKNADDMLWRLKSFRAIPKDKLLDIGDKK